MKSQILSSYSECSFCHKLHLFENLIHDRRLFLRSYWKYFYFLLPFTFVDNNQIWNEVLVVLCSTYMCTYVQAHEKISLEIFPRTEFTTNIYQTIFQRQLLGLTLILPFPSNSLITHPSIRRVPCNLASDPHNKHFLFFFPCVRSVEFRFQYCCDK